MATGSTLEVQWEQGNDVKRHLSNMCICFEWPNRLKKMYISPFYKLNSPQQMHHLNSLNICLHLLNIFTRPISQEVKDCTIDFSQLENYYRLYRSVMFFYFKRFASLIGAHMHCRPAL